jgi:hypothetical protein
MAKRAKKGRKKAVKKVCCEQPKPRFKSARAPHASHQYSISAFKVSLSLSHVHIFLSLLRSLQFERGRIDASMIGA